MRLQLAVVIALAFLAGGPAGSEGPLPISPGAPSSVAVVADSCPTFHWAAAEGAATIDLVVYRVPRADGSGPPNRILRLQLPGAASGWTPTLEQCLEPGARYAWSVGAGGDWSEAHLFEISRGPSMNDIAEALRTLEAFVSREGLKQKRASAAEPIRGERETPPIGGPADPAVPPVLHQPEESPTRIAERAAPLPSSSPALVLDEQIHLGLSSGVFLDGVSFIWTDATAVAGFANVALGLGALKSTTGTNNTAVGHTALRANTTGARNSAFGEDALLQNESGSDNSAFGEDALLANTFGSFNSAFGVDALYWNQSGDDNSAFGAEALRSSTSANGNSGFGRSALKYNEANFNSAFGYLSLSSTTSGGHNSALGAGALGANVTGSHNTALGKNALPDLVSGSRNIAIGSSAGTSLTDGSFNIMIGNSGEATDDRTIRIGEVFDQQRTFVTAIRGTTTDQDDAIPVLIDGSGQLGTVSSTRRVKRDIRDLGELSDRLLELRPVAFRYRQHVATNPNAVLQFGLIAEEVVEVFPELVVYDEEARPSSVKYQLLSTLLLNELQKQDQQNRLQWSLMGLMFVVTVALTVGRRRFG